MVENYFTLDKATHGDELKLLWKFGYIQVLNKFYKRSRNLTL